MKIQLTYDEILGYVEDKFHVRPTVEVVDNQTLSVLRCCKFINIFSFLSMM